MAKKEKNSFEKICDKLEENYILGENQITYIKKYLKSDLKISEDKDMLLKIKVEAEEADYNSYYSLIISMLAMFFTTIGVITQLLPEMPEMPEVSWVISLFRIVYLIIIIIFLFLASQKLSKRKINHIVKWRKYVLVIVNELIEDHPDKMEQDLKAEQREKQNKKSNKLTRSKKRKQRK